MAPLTWRNVDAPNFGPASDMMQRAGESWSSAFSGFSDMAQTIADRQRQNLDNSFLMRAAGITDSNEWARRLNDGSLFQGINPQRLSSDVLQTALSRRGTLIGDENALQSMAIQRAGEGRTADTYQRGLDLTQTQTEEARLTALGDELAARGDLQGAETYYRQARDRGAQGQDVAGIAAGSTALLGNLGTQAQRAFATGMQSLASTYTYDDIAVAIGRGEVPLPSGMTPQQALEIAKTYSDARTLGGQRPTPSSIALDAQGNGVVGVAGGGEGYTDLVLADGSTVRAEGVRSVRNNNPGNIEFGDFARAQGAVGTDGRFAVFATPEAGRAAQEALLFSSDGYSGLTIGQALNRYAPPSDGNDTSSYTTTVTQAVGAGADTPLASLSPEQRSAMLDAMAQVEGGGGTSLSYGTLTAGAEPVAAAPRAPLAFDWAPSNALAGRSQTASTATAPGSSTPVPPSPTAELSLTSGEDLYRTSNSVLADERRALGNQDVVDMRDSLKTLAGTPGGGPITEQPAVVEGLATYLGLNSEDPEYGKLSSQVNTLTQMLHGDYLTAAAVIALNAGNGNSDFGTWLTDNGIFDVNDTGKTMGSSKVFDVQGAYRLAQTLAEGGTLDTLTRADMAFDEQQSRLDERKAEWDDARADVLDYENSGIQSGPGWQSAIARLQQAEAEMAAFRTNDQLAAEEQARIGQGDSSRHVPAQSEGPRGPVQGPNPDPTGGWQRPLQGSGGDSYLMPQDLPTPTMDAPELRQMPIWRAALGQVQADQAGAQLRALVQNPSPAAPRAALAPPNQNDGLGSRAQALATARAPSAPRAAPSLAQSLAQSAARSTSGSEARAAQVWAQPQNIAGALMAEGPALQMLLADAQSNPDVALQLVQVVLQMENQGMQVPELPRNLEILKARLQLGDRMARPN